MVIICSTPTYKESPLLSYLFQLLKCKITTGKHTRDALYFIVFFHSLFVGICACIREDSPHRSMQSICFIQLHPWGSHIMTKIVVGVCSQPVVSIQEGDKGTGLLAGAHLNLLHTVTETPITYIDSFHLQLHIHANGLNNGMSNIQCFIRTTVP